MRTRRKWEDVCAVRTFMYRYNVRLAQYASSICCLTLRYATTSSTSSSAAAAVACAQCV